jgi:acetyltransferase-like isoleucine patch superfamily enzyme
MGEKSNQKPYNIGHNGKGVEIKYKENLTLGKGNTFNDRCWINARFGIEIGENTLFGPNVLIHSGNHVKMPLEVEQNANDKNSWCKGDRSKRIVGEKIIIGGDVWVGANCIILAGSTIPGKCIIGAGTIITKKNSQKLKNGDIVVNDTKLRVIGNRGEVI